MFAVGDHVEFGRKNGEKTLGEVVKVNRKTVKVKTLEGRGTQRSYAVGTVWTVPKTLAVKVDRAPNEAKVPAKAGLHTTRARRPRRRSRTPANVEQMMAEHERQIAEQDAAERAAMQAEQAFEMRAAFGPGVDVVNIVTGETHRT